MNKKVVYALLPVLAVVAFMGIRSASANGIGGFGFGGMMGGPTLTPDEIATRQTQSFQKEADLLGISVDDVKNAWAQGKTISDLATEKGITQEQLQQKLKDARINEMKTQLQALVDKGVITQAQADQRLTFMQNHMNDVGKKGGMRGHHGGMMGF